MCVSNKHSKDEAIDILTVVLKGMLESGYGFGDSKNTLLPDNISHNSTDWEVCSDNNFNPDDLVFMVKDDVNNRDLLTLRNIIKYNVKYYVRVRLNLSNNLRTEWSYGHIHCQR